MAVVLALGRRRGRRGGDRRCAPRLLPPQARDRASVRARRPGSAPDLRGADRRQRVGAALLLLGPPRHGHRALRPRADAARRRAAGRFGRRRRGGRLRRARPLVAQHSPRDEMFAEARRLARRRRGVADEAVRPWALHPLRRVLLLGGQRAPAPAGARRASSCDARPRPRCRVPGLAGGLPFGSGANQVADALLALAAGGAQTIAARADAGWPRRDRRRCRPCSPRRRPSTWCRPRASSSATCAGSESRRSRSMMTATRGGRGLSGTTLDPHASVAGPG